MLKADNIVKNYVINKKGKGFLKKEKTIKQAVKGISISIERGKIIGLLGMNGAGKTTTIKMLTSMIEPTSGKITVDGIDMKKNVRKVKEKINLISGGERSIYWRLTAKENLEYFGRLYGIKESILKERIEKILEIAELIEYKDIPVEKYSKGMKQRLQIARGLINNPDYIFLDEPTLGLDIMIAKELRSYVKKLANQGKGILLTTHYIVEAEELCDYIYVISGGKIIAEGTPEEIKKQYNRVNVWKFSVNELKDMFVKNLNGLITDSTRVEIDLENNSFNVLSEEKNMFDFVRMIEEHGMRITDVTVLEQTLEDALFKLLEE